jgi:hypothetical protein
MSRVTPLLLAKIGVGVLIVLLFRHLFEILHVDQASRAGAPVLTARPFVLGALAAAFSLALALIAMQANRPWVSFGVALGAIAGLIAYRSLWPG